MISKIGDLLIGAGITDSAGLKRARAVQSASNISLGKALADLGLADENAVAEAIAAGLRLEYLPAEPPEVNLEMGALLPLKLCKKQIIAPLSLNGKSIRLAMANPLDYSTIQNVVFHTSKNVIPVVATESLIIKLIGRLPPTEEEDTLEKLTEVVPEGEVMATEDVGEVLDADALAKKSQLAPVIRLVNLMLSGAAKAGASDIHVEPKESFLLVRQRVDGLLENVFKIPKRLQDSTLSRLKIMSGMDITDRRRSQDGRSQLLFEGKRIDLRVSTLPTQFGEKVVIRLLDQMRTAMPMNEIDLSPDNLKLFQKLLLKPQGMILVTGPTGSGKTSTLYTAVNWVKAPTKNIITVEDPIEYQIDGVSQVQINTKAGVTFAKGLRSILRQDPNIILVGEIRDQETAGIALEASQTGHLLLSTVHTNDATGTVTRLFDLGIEPFLVASALIGILAQRLVQRNCRFCTRSQPPSSEALEKLGGPDRLPPNANWMAGRGCEKCMQTGFKGRLAVHELLQVNDELRALITARASELEIRRVARSAGMRTLLEDGIAKAALGLTTLEAVLHVVAPDQAIPPGEDEIAFDSVPCDTEFHLDAGRNKGRQKPAEKERVLIVDDNRTITSVVKYFLELEGFEVLRAENGLLGLQSAKRLHPRIIVSDMNMPGMDGISMVKAIRADPLTQDIPILMLTSEEGVDAETSALSAGADDYIVKPVEPRRLAARVKALLQRSKGRNLADAK